MADLDEIREGLRANLDTLAGVTVSAYLLANPTPPAIEIQPGPVDYDQAFARGSDLWTLIIRAFVGVTTDIGAQKRLDLMLASAGAASVKALTESDPTLAGTVDDLHVTGCTGYRIYQREGQASVLGCEWTVEVHAPGA